MVIVLYQDLKECIKDTLEEQTGNKKTGDTINCTKLMKKKLPIAGLDRNAWVASSASCHCCPLSFWTFLM